MSEFMAKLDSIDVREIAKNIASSLKKNEKLYSKINELELSKIVEQAILSDIEYLKRLSIDSGEYYDENKGIAQILAIVKKHVGQNNPDASNISEDIADAWDEHLDEIEFFEWD